MLSNSEILQAALDAAGRAAKIEDDRLGGAATEHAGRGFDVGFAWVTIKPARGKFVDFLKKIELGRTADMGSGPGFSIWYSKLHPVATQSVSVHRAAAKAFAQVLEENGIKAVVGSRLD